VDVFISLDSQDAELGHNHTAKSGFTSCIFPTTLYVSTCMQEINAATGEDI